MIFQHQLIESFQRHSQNIALEYNGGILSYKTLKTKADMLTAQLLAMNINKETPVGLLVDDRVSLIIAIIGIINAGCVFVPIDGKLPESRLLSIRDKLNLKYLITSKSIDLPSNIFQATEKLYLEEQQADQADEPVSVQYPLFDGEDSLYIYFTSGSTGIPKGIVGKNNSLLQFILWEIEAFDVDASDRFSQLISPFFDAFLRDVFVPLLAGGTLCIPDEEDALFSEEKIIPFLEASRVSFVHCVPSVFRIINSDTLSSSSLHHLKYILLSGERIVSSELAPWYACFGKRIQLVNLYGTTEATMIRSFYKIQPEDVERAKIPIGKPIADTELMVCNKNLKPCYPLVAGELYIISPYLTKGYLGDEELTREKFILFNEGTPDEIRAFKTGDKARTLPDGQIELLGREDRQVKIRGSRIELDEIENMLTCVEPLRSGRVIKHTDKWQHESLVAIIVKKDPEIKDELAISATEEVIKSKLPDYMVPSRFIVCDTIPLLSSGKVDFNTLQKWAENIIPQQIVPPVNEVEEKLLKLWQELLGEKPISTNDSFHKIGGDSLSIMRLIGRINKAFGIKITLGQLLNHLTIQAQAECVLAMVPDTTLQITKAPFQPDYPLSAAQERMYYNSILNKSGTAYNLSMAWIITSHFNEKRAEEALRALIQRHEALRTAFGSDKGRLYQKIVDEVDFHLEKINVTGQSLARGIEYFIQSFDLQQPPLMRCALLEGDDHSALVVDFHHIICDGHSQMILYRDFIALYNGESLKPQLFQYSDFVVWESKMKTSPSYVSHREFWLNSFEGEVPRLTLPTMGTQTEKTDEKGGQLAFEVDNSVLAPLFNTIQSGEVTHFSVLLSSFSLLLCQLSGQDDMVIGVAAAGRVHQEMEDVVGMFVKTLPLRLLVDLKQTFKSYTSDVGAHFSEAMSHQDYDLIDIVHDLKDKIGEENRRLFDVMIILQNFSNDVNSDQDMLTPYEFKAKASKYPLMMTINEEKDAYNFQIDYLSSWFAQADIEKIANQFKALLLSISFNVEKEMIGYLGGNEPVSNLQVDDMSFNF